MRKVKIREILQELLKTSFFSSWRLLQEVVKKLNQRGISVMGKKIGMISRMLTQMCQDPNTGLEREEIPKEERVGQEKWKYKKVK